MSTLGWIALGLAALAAALVLRAVRRRSDGSAADSPRTVADLVRLRAERTGAAEPDAGPSPEVGSEPEPVVVASPVQPVVARPVVEPSPEPSTTGVRAGAVGHPAGAPAPVGVPASADDTPWNRAARIAESDGIVWATDHDWPGWADWADGDEHGSDAGRPEPVRRAVQLPALPPDLVDTRSRVPVSDPEPAVEAETAVAEPAVAEPAVTEPAVAEDGTPSAPEPVRARRSPAETVAEQAAADLALLRTFGAAVPQDRDDEPSTVSLEGPCCVPAVTEPADGAAQPVAFRVVGRDGVGVLGARLTLLDDRGRDAAGSVADAGGRGTVLAPRPGSYVMVSAAAGHQPGAVAITVAGEPVAADLLLARSASLSGTVHGEDGPIVGARLTLVQDGEIVDGADSGPGGEYRIPDLAAGDYGLTVTAVECEPAAVMVTVPDETDLRRDVEMDPVGLRRPADDVMIGLG